MQEAMIRSPLLSAARGVRHAYFTREGGVSGGIYASLNGGQGSADDADHVTENRRRMASALGIEPQHLLSAWQIHSAKVAEVTAAWTRADRPQVDAMVTRTPGLALGISTADCGPILFADAEAQVIGCCHSGWKGAVGGVIEATVEAMEALGAKRGRIVAALGMTISQANYEVGPEFVERLTSLSAGNAAFLVPSAKAGHAMFDLPGYIMQRLGRLGLGATDDLGLCTYADERRFFSFRRTTHRGEPDYGRHISAIVLEG
ncbi:MAG: peptidoglycan editing factor PgeF [Beijerinckiaceae bacterium]|nr:peptidoglycan editing factor PgeF [Beijerinckiaceae bacterium]